MTNKKQSEFKVQFPTAKTEKIVETAIMREVITRTLAVHPGNGLWYGLSRVGKTTTAREMVKKIKEAYDANNPDAFRAVHFSVGEIAAWSGNEQKKGLKSLYNATLGRIDEGVYMNSPPETIAKIIVVGLMRKNIGLVLIDEAGNLSLDAIRGIMMVYDEAKNMEYRLSLVLIGMDDLPVKVTELPQIEGRIHEWCYFEPYTLEEVTKLLSELHPHFAALDLNDPVQLEQITTIYNLFGGFPGLIVPFMTKLERRQSRRMQPITTAYIKTVHLITDGGKEASIKKSEEIYGGKPFKQPTHGVKSSANGNGVNAKENGNGKPKNKKRGGKRW